jgi:hypothetical protein
VIPAADDALYAIGRIGDLLQALIFVAAGVSLYIRFRSGSEMERQQVKLLAFAAGLLGAAIALTTIAAVFGDAVAVYAATTLPTTIVFALVPIAAGVAVLRYRLYDVDLLINRALVYGATVGIVGVGFVTAALLFQTLLRPFTAGSDLAVAVSTLATVAAFQLPIPVRRRADARRVRDPDA